MVLEQCLSTGRKESLYRYICHTQTHTPLTTSNEITFFKEERSSISFYFQSSLFLSFLASFILSESWSSFVLFAILPQEIGNTSFKKPNRNISSCKDKAVCGLAEEQDNIMLVHFHPTFFSVKSTVKKGNTQTCAHSCALSDRLHKGMVLVFFLGISNNEETLSSDK